MGRKRGREREGGEYFQTLASSVVPLSAKSRERRRASTAARTPERVRRWRGWIGGGGVRGQRGGSYAGKGDESALSVKGGGGRRRCDGEPRSKRFYDTGRRCDITSRCSSPPPPLPRAYRESSRVFNPTTSILLIMFRLLFSLSLVRACSLGLFLCIIPLGASRARARAPFADSLFRGRGAKMHFSSASRPPPPPPPSFYATRYSCKTERLTLSRHDVYVRVLFPTLRVPRRILYFECHN